MEKPKMVMRMAAPAPGQSMEDFKKEIAATHGVDDATVIDGSNMNPEDLKAMLASMGVDADEIDNMLAGREQKKKPGLFQRIQDALLD